MTIDLEKEAVNLRELKMSTTSAVMVDGDVIVPDVKPDIREVLLAEASAEIRSHELSGNQLSVLGTVHLKILYVPETEGEYSPKLKSMTAKFEFQDKLHCPEGTDFVSVRATTEHVEFSVLNSRKMNMKVAVVLKVNAYSQKKFDLCTDIPEDSNLEKRMKHLSMYQIAAEEQKELTIAETLEIPNAQPEIDEILKMDVHAVKGECKLMNRKILLKGTIRVQTLYSSVTDGYSTEHAEHEIPFTEVLDVEGLEESCQCNVQYDIKDFLFAVKENINGEPRMIALEVSLCANISAAKTIDTEVLEDCYSPQSETALQREMLSLTELVNEGSSYLSVKEVMSLPEGMPQIDAVYSLSTKALISELSVEKHTLFLRGKLVVFLLYVSQESEAEVSSLVQEFPFEQSVAIGECDGELMTSADVSVLSESFTLNAASEVEIRCNLEFYSKVLRWQESELVTGCELSAEETAEKTSADLMIYFVQPGDSMWEIAKHYRTTYGRIMTANNLEDSSKLFVGQKLLIPRCRRKE